MVFANLSFIFLQVIYLVLQNFNVKFQLLLAFDVVPYF